MKSLNILNVFSFLASERGFLYADYLLGALYSNSELKQYFDYDEAVRRYTKVANNKEDHYQNIAEAASSALESLSKRFMMYNIRRGGFGEY